MTAEDSLPQVSSSSSRPKSATSLTAPSSASQLPVAPSQITPPKSPQPENAPQYKDEPRGRSVLSVVPPIPKNRSTGNLLSIMSGEGSSDHSLMRYSIDVAHEIEKNSRSPIVTEHDHHGLSGLRRIRQQHSGRPLVHPSAPSSRSTSVVGARSSSMHISLPSPSMPAALGTGPSSPLYLEDLSRFPTESLHSFSFAQTDESRKSSHRGRRWAPSDEPGSDSLHLSYSMVDLRQAGTGAVNFTDYGFGPRTSSPERLNPTSAPSESRSLQPAQEATGPSPTSPLPGKKFPDRPAPLLKRTFTDAPGGAFPDRVKAAETTFDRTAKIAQSIAEQAVDSPVMDEFPMRPGSHNHTRWVPAAQAIFTTEAKPPYTILSANDLACLLFGVTKTEIRKIGILEVVQEERRAWLEKKLRYLDPKEAEKDEEVRPNASTAAAAATALIGSSARIMSGTGPRSPVAKNPRRSQTVHNGDPHPPKTRAQGHQRNNLSRGVLLCGDVVPIQKRNGTTGSASIWVKEKRLGLIWVVEEIYEDSAVVALNAEGEVTGVNGAAQAIWGSGVQTSDVSANALIPRIPRQGIDPREGPIDYAQITRRRYYTCPHSSKVNIPCTVEQVRGVLELRVSSFPHMAGIILITPETLAIKSTNSVFCGSLFGWDKADGKNISTLIPNFDSLVKILTDEDGVELAPGMVVPETSFRKAAALLALREHRPDAANAFLYPVGIPAKHRDGSELKIDVQMRVIQSEKNSDVRNTPVIEVDETDPNALGVDGPGAPQVETVYALWVTYSRHLNTSYGSSPHGTPPMTAVKSPLHQPSPGQVQSRSPVDMHSDSDDHKEPIVRSPVADIPPLRLEPSASDSPVVQVLDSKLTVASPITVSPVATSALAPALEPAAPVVESSPNKPTPIETPALETPGDSTTEPSSLVVPSAPATPVTPSHKPGTRAKATIADYTILEEMGQGAYGQVKLARHNATGRKVVLKYVVKRRILVDTWTRDRKLGTVPLEIHVMSYLRRPEYMHPNIVEMECFFEDNTNYYIEMVPHGMPGSDLFDYIELRANDLAEAECRKIFLQVARAVDHLHNVAKVVHRDIKDENVILDHKGVIKLIDFGSAAYIKSGPFNVFVGTIDYAAPEVLGGQSYNGKEQDVWALGILLYTIIYKENPFYSIDEITDHPLRVPYVMSEDSIDLVRKMLDRNVEQRATITQVLEHPWLQLAIREEAEEANGE